jgi:zinc-ribbon domain
MYCAHCGTKLDDDARFCVSCGSTVAGLAAFPSENDIRNTVQQGESGLGGRRKLLGLAGAAVLFVGVFIPILSVPIVGSINYFQNGRGDGVIIVVFALLAALFSARRAYRLLWIPGLACLALLVYTFISVQSKLAEAKAAMTADLADNPFKGVAEAIAGSIQLQWGWAVLVLGAVLLLVAAVMRDGGSPATGPAFLQSANQALQPTSGGKL